MGGSPVPFAVQLQLPSGTAALTITGYDGSSVIVAASVPITGQIGEEWSALEVQNALGDFVAMLIDVQLSPTALLCGVSGGYDPGAPWRLLLAAGPVAWSEPPLIPQSGLVL
jgi:hypothetical protein